MNHDEILFSRQVNAKNDKEKKAADGIAVLNKRSKALVVRHDPTDHEAYSPRHGEEPAFPETNNSDDMNSVKIRKKSQKN